MLRIIAIGDPHFRTKYIQVLDQFVVQTMAVIKAVNPDLVVVLGDTLHHHEKTDSECHVRAVKWFLEISKITKLVVLIGNHDRRNNSDFLSDYHFFSGLKFQPNIWIADTVLSLYLTFTDGKLASISERPHDRSHSSAVEKRLVFVPYVAPGRFLEALNTSLVTMADYRPFLIFAHQEFKGAKMGALVSEAGDVWSETEPPIISGHIHEQDLLQPNIFYAGTPYQTTYAESPDKGLYLFTIDDINTEFKLDADLNSRANKLIRLTLKVKKSITVSVDEFKQLLLRGTDVANFAIYDNNLYGNLIASFPESNVELRIKVVGIKSDIVTIKSTKNYIDLKSCEFIKLVLTPVLDTSVLETHRTTTTFENELYKKIAHDDGLKRIYAIISSGK